MYDNKNIPFLMIESGYLGKNQSSLYEGDVIARLELGDKHISLEMNGKNNLELVKYIVENDDYIECQLIDLVDEMPKTTEDIEKTFSKWLSCENKADNLRYLSNGNPTDRQIELQDDIDNIIWNFINEITNIYAKNSTELQKMMENLEAEVAFNWDIEKISDIRNHVELVLELPDIY